MGDSARHARIPPTREVFYSPTTGTGAATTGAHVGFVIDDQAEDCNIEVMVPWDFKELVELVLVVIPITTAFQAIMTLSVFCQFAKPNQASNENNVVDGANVPIQHSWVAVANYIQEINITDMVQRTNQFADRGLEAGDYLGVDVSRDATNGDNTNANILGVRMRYKVFRGK